MSQIQRPGVGKGGGGRRHTAVSLGARYAPHPRHTAGSPFHTRGARAAQGARVTTHENVASWLMTSQLPGEGVARHTTCRWSPASTSCADVA
jgi:hypothetical protein